MIYLDKILNSIIDNSNGLSIRDYTTLKNIDRLTNSANFITENQARLLIKILKNNINNISIDHSILENPIWSKPLRVIETIKRLSLTGSNPDDLRLTIEVTSNSSIKKEIAQLSSKIPYGFYHDTKGVSTELTEENVVILVEELSKLGFDIDPVIQNHYDTIVSWNKTDYINQYKINTISHSNFKLQLTNDLGINTPLDDNLIADRSIRYQYYVEKNTNPSTLTEIIANRNSPRLWIDSSQHTIENLISSLVELRRLPILVVFDTKNVNEINTSLTTLHDSFINHNIDDVGIYFRLSNTTDAGAEFNRKIAEFKYNAHLDQSVQVVGIETTKLPKFMINNDWKPMSVISIGHSLRHSKSAVYANCCDLIISYVDNEPIFELRTTWE